MKKTKNKKSKSRSASGQKTKAFYLTTTLPYVNAEPHIGFALEIINADIAVRYRKLLGHDVFFNTGTDEHGLKVYRKALEEGKDTQSYVDEYAEKFRALKKYLDLYPEIAFIRTTDAHHKKAAQEFWRRCQQNGDIYKKNYTTKYCVGCELEKTESELVAGKCAIHPNLELELIAEENYFFRFSKFGKPLLEHYRKNPDFVRPHFRFNEIIKFVEAGLEDFSISRVKEKMPWGVPVPGDDRHVMYVWFDALVNYISTLGWPENEKKFEKFWGTKKSPNAVQMAGKDQIRQQAAMWQAMLLSAGLPTTKRILIHGFITVNGQKMSKSLGNVIDPLKIIDEYGIDALRYFLARHIHPFEDSDFTFERFRNAYNADLANGLGNQAARIMKLAKEHLGKPIKLSKESAQLQPPYCRALDAYRPDEAISIIWKHIQMVDDYIDKQRPFVLVKSENKKDRDEGKKIIAKLVLHLATVATHLSPVLPDTSRKIMEAVRQGDMPPTLFPRKE